MADLLFYSMYTTSKVGTTGLTVTIDIWRVTRSSAATSEVVTAGSAAELGDGVYLYRLASADPTLYDYVAIFKTATDTVDQQHIPALWTQFGVESSLQTGAVSAAAVATGAIDADALAADAGTEIGTAVWASATRTLTQTAAEVTEAVSGSTLTIARGDTWSATLTGLAANTGYVSIDLTVKSDLDDDDDDAILKIRLNAPSASDGLLYLNGAAPVAPVVSTDGTITVNSATSITVALAARATDDLVPQDGLYYDIQYVFATSVQTVTEGICNITADVTRSIA